MATKTVVFKDKEVFKEGVAANGRPWTKYQYYGDDGEHYILFDNLDIDKPYELTQKTRTHNGKEYTDWVLASQGGARGGGARAILERLEILAVEVSDIKRAIMEISDRMTHTATVRVDDPDLPF